MLVKEVVSDVDRAVFTIQSDKTVEDAIVLMDGKETTGLIVQEGSHPVGIFTERDILISYIKFEKRPFREISLSEAMTRKLVVARPEDELASTISMMTKLDIRHLPVVEDGRIISVLPICDLVQHQVGMLSTELRYLEDYLDDLQEAVTD